MEQHRMRQPEVVTLTLDFIQDRDKSIVVSDGRKDDKGNLVWIFLPKSVTEDHGDGTYSLPMWLATEKGLV